MGPLFANSGSDSERKFIRWKKLHRSMEFGVAIQKFNLFMIFLWKPENVKISGDNKKKLEREEKKREKKKTCWSSSLGLDDQHHTLFIIKRRIFSEFIKKEWWYFLTKQSPTFLKLQKSPLRLTTSGMGDETCLRCETCFWNGELMQCHWSSFHKVDSISIFRMMLVGSLVQGWFLHCDLESFSFYSTLAFCTSSLS